MPAKPTTPPPAYFLSLSLENVRSFGEKQTIYFTEGGKEGGRSAQWTVILGDNGVGKTTVLKALAGLRPSFSLEKGHYHPALFDKPEIWRPFRHDGDLLSKVGFAAQTGISLTTTSTKDAKANNVFKGFSFFMRGKQPDLPDKPFWDSVESDLFGLICYGYGAGRTVGNSTLSETPEGVDTCASLFDDRADLLDPQEWFLNIDYGIRLSADDKGKHKQLSDANTRVRQMLKDVLPGVTDLRIDNSGTPQRPQISLQFLLYGTWVRLRDMSLGYQTLVVWLTDLASKLYARYPESDNPLAEPAIVLIDEIDLHLHPQWQRELLGMLSKIFPETQFIATAHSPLVVQAAGDEGANVVLLRREGDQTVVSQNPVDVRGWRVDQILTSTFFNLETARSVDTEKKLTRQAKLLNKPKLTAKERQELDDLTMELEGQPMGSVGAEQEEAELMRQIAARLGTDAAKLTTKP